jgi:hypothetical protein
MKKLIIASIVAGGLGGTALGFAATEAGVAHHRWVNDHAPHATAPKADTTVHQSR